MVGNSSTIVMLMYAVAVPPEFVAVMVDTSTLMTLVGNTVVSPSEVSKDKPYGSE